MEYSILFTKQRNSAVINYTSVRNSTSVRVINKNLDLIGL